MKHSIEMMIAALLLSATSTAAVAQRDPAYQAARTQGLVGEQVDGRLGVVGAPSAAIRVLVDEINAKRRDIYTTQAQANQVTLAVFSKKMGCKLIKETAPGEKYQAPDGSWQTRTSAPPMLDPACA